MKQADYFGHAIWVCAPDIQTASFPILRGRFKVEGADRVTLNLLGLGFFKCYINGTCINPDTFLPLSSEFEAGCEPSGEVFTAHRVYVPSFDITPYVKDGDNVIAIHFGGGWYTYEGRKFGDPKAIYRILVQKGDEAIEFASGTDCRIVDSFVTGYHFTQYETHDYTAFSDCLGADFDDSHCPFAAKAKPLDTEYCETPCPTDGLIEVLDVRPVGRTDSGTVYDCGINTTGYPVLRLEGDCGETVTVRFSEACTADRALDPTHMHWQCFTVTCDGTTRTVQPEFTWFGFRYFEVIGRATPLSVKVVHARIPVTSTFDSDNETLNWIYKTFLHTMLCNMHTGHPSDCPHLERRGYTGDGQLTCHAALSILGAKEFYEKWMQDISDSQDTLSGHVQYTAPYLRSGGGPGGWGCAIVEVPYQLYLHYGDASILAKYYDGMRRYIDYLEAHSEFHLVTSDRAGEWCLGDWCGPVILYPDKDITAHNQQVMLPAPMVNTYFMVKSLLRLSEIARILGREQDIAEYLEKAETGKRAIQAAYFNTFDGNFVMNIQGANAYAVDLGLGDGSTYPNMVRYYRKLGHYDTGIFATDILTRVLFEHGDCDLAFDLLTQNGNQGYAHWKENGATTLHEYWDSNRSRSHSHPMFGAAVAYLFEYLLGIRQAEGSAGYRSLVIAPVATHRLGRLSGSMETPNGRVSVKYRHNGDRLSFRICIPEGTRAVFRHGTCERALTCGENVFCIPKD